MAEPTLGTLLTGNSAATTRKPSRKGRIVALEIRHSKFGFVAFDGPNELLGWKVRSFAGPTTLRRAILEKRISYLLDLYAPSAVVVRRRNGPSTIAGETILSVVRTIRAITRSKSTKFHMLDTRTIRSFFADHGCKTKHDIASLIAEWFQELSWRLPSNRKAWQKEAFVMPIFDATATGIAFFHELERRDSKTKPDRL